MRPDLPRNMVLFSCLEDILAEDRVREALVVLVRLAGARLAAIWPAKMPLSPSTLPMFVPSLSWQNDHFLV